MELNSAPRPPPKGYGKQCSLVLSDDIENMTIGAAARLMRARKLSPVEVVESILRRIEQFDHIYRSYISVTQEAARAAACRAEATVLAGNTVDPLLGIPYGLKDNYLTKGVRTTAGSRLLLDFVPDEDATLHRRLEQAGAILVGKLNTWEFGTGTGELVNDLPFPVALNPWNIDRFSGGSSTGAGVAVAAGLAMMALGTDTGGSVRIPAAACGIVGLKPTYGRLSRAGILPNSYSLDHPGIFTRTVEDSALLLAAIAGFDPRDPTTVDRVAPGCAAWNRGIKGVRIGVIRRFHEQDYAADKEIVVAVEQALQVFRSLGADLVELQLPIPLKDYRLCTRVIGSAEAYSAHEQDFQSRRGEMGKALRDKLAGGLCIRASDYLKAVRWRRELAVRTDEIITTCDAVVCAGTLRLTPLLSDVDGIKDYVMGSAMCPFNATGHPALVQCIGLDTNGMPLSMQIVGRYFDEETVFQVAAAYEAATGWQSARPGLERANDDKEQELLLRYNALPEATAQEVSPLRTSAQQAQASAAELPMLDPFSEPAHVFLVPQMGPKS